MTVDERVSREIIGLGDVREINKVLRSEIRQARTGDEIAELKRRSDELCAMTLAPSWTERFGRKSRRFYRVAREENVRTTRIANSTARRRGIEVEYRPYQVTTSG